MFIDKVYTFLEIGELAYKHNVLTSKEGLEIIQRRAKQPEQVSSEVLAGAIKGASKPGVTLSELLNEAHDTAAAFKAQHQLLGNPQIPNASQGLQQLVGGTISSDEVIVVDDVPLIASTGDHEGLGISDLTLEQWKSRDLAAEYKVKELEKYQNSSIHEIAVLRSKLNSSEVLNVGYLAELDKKDQLLKLVNDNIASSVISAVSSKLEKLTNIQENVNNILELISPSDENTQNVFDQSLQVVCDRADSNCNSIVAGIKETNDTLTSFGMCSSENNLNIPLTLDFLLGMISQGDGTHMSNVTTKDRICYYETNSKDQVLKCKCNCGFEVTAKMEDAHDDPSMRNRFDVSQLDLSQPPPSIKPCLTTPSQLPTQLVAKEGNSGIHVPGRTSRNKPYDRHGNSQDSKTAESSSKSKTFKPRQLFFKSATPNPRLFKNN